MSWPAAHRDGPGVALDVQALQMEGWADRGVGRYIVGYATALARRGALASALLAPELPPPAGLPNDLVAAGLVRWDTAATCRDLVGGPLPVVHHLTAPFLHVEPGGRAGLAVVEHWARSGVSRVVLLHDLIPLRAPRHYLVGPGAQERYRARAEWVGGADLIITNSEHTRSEAVDLLGCDPQQVVTVGVGVLPFFSPPDGTDEELWQFHFRALAGRPHVLTVGGSDARKGTDRAIAALGLLVARGFDLSLLVIGHLTPGWRRDLGVTAQACGVADRVVFAGPVDDELLRACYRRALITLMPSLAEGAGLPVLESAASGTPALASGTTALAETAAHPAALFDPTDVGSMADTIGAAVDSAARRAAILAVQQELAASSTWDAVADRAVTAIDRLAGVRRPAIDRLVGASRPASGRLAGRATSGGAGSPGGVGSPGGAGFGGGPAFGGDWPGRLVLVGWPAMEEDLLAAVRARWGGEVQLVEAGGADHLPPDHLPPDHLPPGHLPPGRQPGGPAVLPAAAFGVDVAPASFDGVVYVLTGGPADRWVLDKAARYPGWLWVWAAAHLVEFPAERLVRRSLGVMAASPAVREEVRLALRPLVALPPLGVVPAVPARAATLVEMLRGGRDAGRVGRIGPDPVPEGGPDFVAP